MRNGERNSERERESQTLRNGDRDSERGRKRER